MIAVIVVLTLAGVGIAVGARSEASASRSVADWVHALCTDTELRKADVAERSARDAWYEARSRVATSEKGGARSVATEAEYRAMIDSAIGLFEVRAAESRTAASAIGGAGHVDLPDGEYYRDRSIAAMRDRESRSDDARAEVARLQRQVGSSTTYKEVATRATDLERELSEPVRYDDRASAVAAVLDDQSRNDTACDWMTIGL